VITIEMVLSPLRRMSTVRKLLRKVAERRGLDLPESSFGMGVVDDGCAVTVFWCMCPEIHRMRFGVVVEGRRATNRL